jgi:xylulokinase
MATDYSYASGSGVYDLKKWQYSQRLIKASGLPSEIFPEPVESTKVLACLTEEAAKELGLHTGVQVVAGGVDNSCMALGARCYKDGRIYNSQGSSSWIAVSSSEPLLNAKSRPYVFTHVVPGLFTSATAIFSAGTSFRWLRDTVCQNLKEEDGNIWEQMTALAKESPTGANKLLFNPSLAGGTMIDTSPIIRGAFAGIDLSHTQNDMIRSAMEGIALGLRVALDELQELTKTEREITAVGGGSKSELWRQIYANVYNTTIVKTNIDEQAAALGAAALAAVGTGIWDDFSIIDDIHKTQSVESPQEDENALYERFLPVYKKLSNHLSEIGDLLTRV